MKKTILLYSFTLLGSSILIFSIFLAPILKNNLSPWSGFFYMVFSPLCHQIPSRCFTLFGFPLAVCTRCLGIYCGFFGGTLVFPVIKGFSNTKIPDRKYLLLFSFPIVLDTAANFFDLWATPDWGRFILGFIWGSILPFYFIGGIADMMNIKWKKTFKKK